MERAAEITFGLNNVETRRRGLREKQSFMKMRAILRKLWPQQKQGNFDLDISLTAMVSL